MTGPFLPQKGGSTGPFTLGLQEGCVWKQAELRSQKANRGEQWGLSTREEGRSKVLGRGRQEEVDAKSKEGCHLELVSSLLQQCPGVCLPFTDTPIPSPASVGEAVLWCGGLLRPCSR